MSKDEMFKVFYGKETWCVYRKFQEIEKSIDESQYLYQYFDEIKLMLNNQKSVIRMRGFRIICKLAKYDVDNKIDEVIDILLDELDDDKPTNVRQCLKALTDLIIYKKGLINIIKNKLNKINYLKYKDSMSSLIKKDIDNILNNL